MLCIHNANFQSCQIVCGQKSHVQSVKILVRSLKSVCKWQVSNIFKCFEHSQTKSRSHCKTIALRSEMFSTSQSISCACSGKLSICQSTVCWIGYSAIVDSNSIGKACSGRFDQSWTNTSPKAFVSFNHTKQWITNRLTCTVL